MIVESDHRARVLVVDDNELNRKLLTRALEQQGHSATTTQNGREALALLRKDGGDDFDVVLLDILMPEMDGYATLAEMQGDSLLRHIPVIMISALDEMDSVIRCIELGATDYLPKPFNPTLLRARIGASLEKKRLRDQEQKVLRALERELEIGREIQSGFLPRELPQPPGWEIAARFQPAHEVAGDFYDAFYLGEEKVSLVVGDVCDKGVGAALFMALVRSLFRALALRNFATKGSDAARLEYTITQTNDYIVETHGNSNMFATAFVAALDLKSKSITYVNAGQNPPLIIGNNRVRAELVRTGPAIGVIPGMKFDVLDARLETGETLLAYTDGVTDAVDPNRNEFSANRLESLAQLEHSSAADLLDAIQSELRNHIASVPQIDDITLLAARRM
jgi:serine phosphatase RsbU (regulator of sigma subunit)